MSTYMTLNTFDKRGVSPNTKKYKKEDMIMIKDIVKSGQGNKKMNMTLE